MDLHQKEAVKNKISAYADMETRNRMENTEMKRIDPHMIRVPEVQNEASIEDPYENKNTVPHRPSAAIENMQAQRIPLNNPDTPVISKDNIKNAETQWKHSRTGSEGPSFTHHTLQINYMNIMEIAKKIICILQQNKMGMLNCLCIRRSLH